MVPAVLFLIEEELAIPQPQIAILIILNALVFVFSNRPEFDDHFVASIRNLESGRWWCVALSEIAHHDLNHFSLNMICLFSIGPIVAEILNGKYEILIFYVAAGVTGSLMQLLVNPHVGSLGASGALFAFDGLIITKIVMDPRFTLVEFFWPIFETVIIMAIEIEEDWNEERNIAHWAHFGGAIFGCYWALNN